MEYENRMADMSEYDRKAWEKLTRPKASDNSSGFSSRMNDLSSGFAARSKKVQSAAGTSLSSLVQRVPKGPEMEALVRDAVNDSMGKALESLHSTTVDFGLASVNYEKLAKKYSKAGLDVQSFRDIQSQSLKDCDRMVGKGKQVYSLVGLIEGAGSSVAVTGLTVASTVSAGTSLAVAVGAVATDSVFVLTGMGRIVASVAAHYGFDVNEPEEQLYATSVLSYTTASGSAEKAASLASLSRLTQQMMRGATWRSLNNNVIVGVIRKVFSSLGVKLTHRKLASAVPVFGIALNGGLNVSLARKTFERAQEAYRLRYLSEKYGLDPELWVSSVIDAEFEDVLDEKDTVDVEEMLAEAIELESSDNVSTSSEAE